MKLIHNLDDLLKFINLLPDTEQNEKYFVALMSRKKYDPHCSDSIIFRAAVKKADIFQTIWRWECPEESLSSAKKTINPSSVVVYINPNPRCLQKATIEAAKHFVQLISQQYNGYDPSWQMMDIIQKSKAKSNFVNFDFDCVTLPDIYNYVESGSVITVKTRGGYHFLVNPSLNRSKPYWYQKISALNGCDQVGDSLIPVPGCRQGDFVPELI